MVLCIGGFVVASYIQKLQTEGLQKLHAEELRKFHAEELRQLHAREQRTEELQKLHTEEMRKFHAEELRKFHTEELQKLHAAQEQRTEELRKLHIEEMQSLRVMVHQHEDEMARKDEATLRTLGQISAQYMSRILIDMGVKRYLLRTTGRPSGRTFGERLRAFADATIVPEGGSTAAEPVRAELREIYAQLQKLLAFSPEGVQRHLCDLGHLASELNAPHHELLTVMGAPGFYVAGWQFHNDLVAVIALICAALQRDAVDDFPPVRVLTRNDVMAFHVKDAAIQQPLL